MNRKPQAARKPAVFMTVPRALEIATKFVQERCGKRHESKDIQASRVMDDRYAIRHLDDANAIPTIYIWADCILIEAVARAIMEKKDCDIRSLHHIISYKTLERKQGFTLKVREVGPEQIDEFVDAYALKL